MIMVIQNMEKNSINTENYIDKRNYDVDDYINGGEVYI